MNSLENEGICNILRMKKDIKYSPKSVIVASKWVYIKGTNQRILVYERKIN